MITDSGAVDCQHEAEEVVSIKRKRLSVVGLHKRPHAKKLPDSKKSGGEQLAFVVQTLTDFLALR
jgi:hypothetical protein